MCAAIIQQKHFVGVNVQIGRELGQNQCSHPSALKTSKVLPRNFICMWCGLQNCNYLLQKLILVTFLGRSTMRLAATTL